MTPSADHDRWLHLTLAGDRHAAASLLTFAQRRGDPLLGLIAEVVSAPPVTWESAREVLDAVPADALSPQVFAHLQERLPAHRPLTTAHDAAFNRLLAPEVMRGPSAPSATLCLTTYLSLTSASTDGATWEALCVTPLESLRSVALFDAALSLRLSLLDPAHTPWLSRLYRLYLYTSASDIPASVQVDFTALLKRLSCGEDMALTEFGAKGYRVTADSVRALAGVPWAKAALMAALRRCARSQRVDAVPTAALWVALADLSASGPGAASLPEVSKAPLIAPDGVFAALWTRLNPAHLDNRDDPGVFQSALRALRLGAACAFACDRFFVSAALSRADLLVGLLSSLDEGVRMRLLLRLCPRRLHYAANVNTDRPLGPLGEALLRSAALRAYFPPFAPDWPRPARGRARAKWLTLASFNLCAVAQVEGEDARAQIASLREREDPFLQEIAQQRLNRLDRLRRIAAPDLADQSDDTAPKETSP